jgi:uncharacterized short protein YbdD (DUF466 family)|tara:strand:- start:3206 stop:3454 length:249 start_codon:yes stop_codon:yes gene_type:complete
MNNEINRPPHYNKNTVETIDIIRHAMTEEEFHGYLKGNIIKYVSRHKHKHPAEPEKDLLKARWYLQRLIETYRKEQENAGEE